MQLNWTDAQSLEALYLHEVCGWTYQKIGDRLGKTRSAIAGHLGKIKRDLAGMDLEHNQDGTMPERWWEAGLSAQKRRAA